MQSSCLENPRARFCEWLGKRTRVTVAKCKVGEFRDRQPVWSHMRQVPSAKCKVLKFSHCARLFLKKLLRSHEDKLEHFPRCARKIVFFNPQNMCKVQNFTISESQNLRIPSHHALVHTTCGYGTPCSLYCTSVYVFVCI